MLPLLLAVSPAQQATQNFFENDLKPCSSSGMAMTGFTRDGYCTE